MLMRRATAAVAETAFWRGAQISRSHTENVLNLGGRL